MTDEVSKPLLKGDNFTLLLKLNDGRIRLGANQLDGSYLQLREREKLEVIVRDGSLVVMRKPDFGAVVAELKAQAAENEDST